MIKPNPQKFEGGMQRIRCSSSRSPARRPHGTSDRPEERPPVGAAREPSSLKGDRPLGQKGRETTHVGWRWQELMTSTNHLRLTDSKFTSG